MWLPEGLQDPEGVQKGSSCPTAPPHTGQTGPCTRLACHTTCPLLGPPQLAPAARPVCTGCLPGRSTRSPLPATPLPGPRAPGPVELTWGRRGSARRPDHLASAEGECIILRRLFIRAMLQGRRCSRFKPPPLFPHCLHRPGQALNGSRCHCNFYQGSFLVRSLFVSERCDLAFFLPLLYSLVNTPLPRALGAAR